MKTKLLTIAMTAALMFTAMTKVQAQNFDGPCLPPAHGLVDHQSAFCSAMQVIALASGWNWVSTYVAITMDDLKDAIVAAYPSAGMNALSIKSKDDGQSNYNPVAHRWISGPSTIHLEQMYMVKVPSDGTITLEGMPINPAELSITVTPGINWIAFPLSTEMTLSEAFAGFPAQGDNISSYDDGQANWNSGANRWIGTLNNNNLKPGKGYIYNSKATQNKTLVFPSGSSKAAPAPTKLHIYPLGE